MGLRLCATSVILGLVVGCGGGEGADRDPGTELGPCVEGRYCEAPLVCTADSICVHPDQAGTDGDTDQSSDSLPKNDADDTSPGQGTSGGSTDGGDTLPDPDPSGGGAEIYCSQEGDACWCSHNADWGVLGEVCGPAAVGSPSQCCATDASWPTTGTCNCSRLYCSRDYDSCFCNTVAPDETEELVDSCSSDSGVCCQDTELGWCLCWDDLKVCPPDDGYVEVSSCSVASVDCGDNAPVTTCN